MLVNKCANLLTIVSDAARGLMGPDARAGANDGYRSVREVSRLTAVSEQRPWRERPPVGFGLIQQIAVLDTGRPRTTCTQTRDKKSLVNPIRNKRIFVYYYHWQSSLK